METVILFSLLSASLFYLGSRARITSFIWSRYPKSLAHFADCASCTGFWWGYLLALIVGYNEGWTYLGLSMREPWTHAFVGLCSIVTTPITAGVMQLGIEWLGNAVPESDGDSQ